MRAHPNDVTLALLRDPISKKDHLLSYWRLGPQHTNFRVGYNPTRRRQWQPIPVLLPGKSHGQRCLVGACRWLQSMGSHRV